MSTSFRKLTAAMSAFVKEMTMHEHKKGDEHTRRRFLWLDQVLADQSLPMGAFQVAYVIAQHINRSTGDAWLGTRRLSEKAGVSRPFAIKAMRLLETAGHLAVETGEGRGNTNRYQMVEKGAPGEQEEMVNGEQEMVNGVNHFDEINGQRQNVNGQRQDEKGKPGGPDSFYYPLKNPFKNPLTPASPSAPLGESGHRLEADLFKQQGKEAKEGKQASKKESAPQKFRRPPRKIASVVPDSFNTFWDAYPRHKSKGAAEKAYIAALEIASAAEILAGAQRYATERNGQDPKFTKHPATWLNQKCWTDGTDEPPTARTFDETGRPVAPPYQANGHRMSKGDENIARNLENCRRMGLI